VDEVHLSSGHGRAGLSGTQLRWPLLVLIAAMLLASPAPIGQARATPRLQAAEIWLLPMNDASHHSHDDHDIFDHPQIWPGAAHTAGQIVLGANSLLQTPAPAVVEELARFKAEGLRLDVFLGVLPVDKKLCGIGVEGLAWPGEAASYAAKLRKLGADVASFTFDLPLSDGHFLRPDPVHHACTLSIADTAQRLAAAVRAMRAYYPKADLFDAEVPTGMPTAEWVAGLSEWLDDFTRAAGEPFSGVIMDAWWAFPWQDTVRQTTELLHARGIKAGIFIDESDGRKMPAEIWLNGAKRHDCAVRATGAPLDLLVVANWSNPAVPNGPETDALTLTRLLDWVAEHGACPP
jgi:hypothetical protein